MPPRRNPRRSAGSAETNNKNDNNNINTTTSTGTSNETTTTPAKSTTSTTTSRTTRTAKSKKYESTPVPQQVTFPARRKIVRKYGGRRSLPARLEEETASVKRRNLKQQTLTQIDYVRSSSGMEPDDLLEDEELGGSHEEEDQQQEQQGDEVEVTKVAKGRKPADRRSKRRKTMGDVPTPSLERKRSSFHTQTLTQFLGNSALPADADILRVEDEDVVKGLPLPGDGTPVKHFAQPRKGNDKALTTPNPHTPSNKRIRVSLDEVPSSQPTPFTPLLGHSPIAPARSPLTQKSTNVDVPLPTIETASKLPRTLVIQDSYSVDSSSVGYSTSVAGDTPKKEREKTPSQSLEREPLAEIPVASLELGVGSSPNGETPTTRRKRMFIEIPDSDDELESIGSTPFKTPSARQTPLKREAAAVNFAIAADSNSPRRLSQASRVAVTETPASSSKSDKENASPAIRMWEDEDAAGEGDDGDTPTPTRTRRSQTAGRASQASPNTASQFWTASAENLGNIGAPHSTSREPLVELAVAEEPTVMENKGLSPIPRASQFHGSMGGSSGRICRATPQLEDSEETASEVEEEQMPVSILRKTKPRADSHAGDGRKRNSTPEPNRSESSTSEPPGTPTPVVRKVQIELPQSSAEEVCRETPRKPHKSSPIYQRHTQGRSQARSQFYSQGLESQRVPLEVIRSLGPQTDRSDILISIDAKTVEDMANGLRDHEFRNYRFPVQVSRCWIFTELPVGEVKYMATLGPAQEPGQIDSRSGRGNAEFNRGTSGYKFAHRLRQVYQLNNPVPLADMEDNAMGTEPPQRYKYLPPAVVGQLLMNLRCPLFAEDDITHDVEEVGPGNQEAVKEGGVTISQELEDQLRSDLIHSTQLKSSERRRQQRLEGDDFIPASQSPTEKRSVTATAAPAAAVTVQKPDDNFARPPVPLQSRQTRQQPTSSRHSVAKRDAHRYVRPSQATTASDVSAPCSQALSSPPRPDKLSASSSIGPPPASMPRPPLPDSGELSLLSSSMWDLPRYDDDHQEEGSSGSGLLPVPTMTTPRAGGTGLLLHLSSSQVGVLPPDSLLMDEGRPPPPPVEVWDSEEEEDEDDDNDDDDGERY
ncbi:hypothetical protein P885DRAFT_43230 [Corynascus similis CBS 632.67]